MSIKLSLCIPTYNRAKFLKETLDSIIEQASENIEIVVSDNGSTDETEAIIQEYQKQFPRLRYFRFCTNQGAERNFLNVVEIATGEYCWLLGSDDKLEEGAIVEILSKLALFPHLAGITINFWAYDFYFKNRKWTPAIELHQDTLFTNAEKGFEALCLIFGLLSAQICKRDLWMKVISEKKIVEDFHGYVHVYMIGEMLLKHPQWLFVHSPCVGWREGNDSFLQDGYYKRLEIDVLGYGKIVPMLFPKQKTFQKKVLSKIGRCHILPHLKQIKCKTRGKAEIFSAWKLTWKHYSRFPFFWYKLLPFFAIPSLFLKTKAIRLIYCYFRRISWHFY
jgi:abequosyltransferase